MVWLAWDKLCLPKDRGGLGFRDFNKFNDALLGKQAWRLLTEDSSLMVRVLRGKYFQDKSFMDAELGTNPSFTWRSILSARSVLELGVRKRLGDCQTTRVYMDPWVPGTSTRRVISPRADKREHMLVAELLDNERGGWNYEKVCSLFLPFECDRILRIRRRGGDGFEEDQWCWDVERDGVYSVKSAYKLLAKNYGHDEEPSDYKKESALWKRIWKCPVIPRIKIFFWQLCHEAIATKGNIARRIKGADESCPNCNSGKETCLHVVRDCGWVGGIWEGLGMDVWEETGVVRVREWVEDMMRETSESEWVTLMVGCWAIWERRNKVVFEGSRWCEMEVLERVRSLLWEMKVEERDCKVHEVMAGKGQRRAEKQALGSGEEEWGCAVWQGSEGETLRGREEHGRGRRGVELDRTEQRGQVHLVEQEREGAGWRKPGREFVKINVDAGIRAGVGVAWGIVAEMPRVSSNGV